MSTEVAPSRSPGPGRRVWLLAGFVVVALAVTVALVIASDDSRTGDPGRLSEPQLALPVGIVLPAVADATTDWGLETVQLQPAADQMAGGVAIADFDGDGALDIAVANGQVGVAPWRQGVFGALAIVPGIDDAIGVSAADIDLDGYVDLLVARAGDVDTIVWGPVDQAAEHTSLESAGPTSALLVGELTGDLLVDIVRLGRGSGDMAEPDVLWRAEPAQLREFEPVELPLADRFSLAGELLDVDGDGLLDIWVTRDVGWARGADSVLSRRGDATGDWVDVAPDLGADLAIDGMGITVADFDGDDQLDAYLSDLGDNELLRRTDSGFVAQVGAGAAHIRPQGATEDMVSSSWGSGAIDLNLDGVMDLVVASGGFPNGAVRNKIDGTEIAVAEAPAMLIGHGDGRFSDVWGDLGLSVEITARGLAVGDLDGDGDDDVVIAKRDGTVVALRTDSPGSAVSLSVESPCVVAGVTVTVRNGGRATGGLLVPHGYASSHSATFVTGLADDMSGATIDVLWPNGDGETLVIEPDGGRSSFVARCPDLDTLAD